MNTCDTCKHWKGKTGYGKYRFCKNKKLTDSTDDEKNNPDGVALEGVISTGPKFGCIHHDPILPTDITTLVART